MDLYWVGHGLGFSNAFFDLLGTLCKREEAPEIYQTSRCSICSAFFRRKRALGNFGVSVKLSEFLCRPVLDFVHMGNIVEYNWGGKFLLGLIILFCLSCSLESLHDGIKYKLFSSLVFVLTKLRKVF